MIKCKVDSFGSKKTSISQKHMKTCRIGLIKLFKMRRLLEGDV